MRFRSLSLMKETRTLSPSRLPYFLKINFSRLVAPVYLGSKFGLVLALARRSRKRRNESARPPVCCARASSTSSFPLSRQGSNGQSLNPLSACAREREVSRDRKTSKDNWSSPVFAVRAPTKAFLVSRGRFPRGEKTPREENDDRGRNLLIPFVFSGRAPRREYIDATAASDKCGYPIWFYRLISFTLDRISVWRASLCFTNYW